MEPQRAISSNERPHPMQRRDGASIVQTFVQGDEIIALH
jgi:hypothetical protein